MKNPWLWVIVALVVLSSGGYAMGNPADAYFNRVNRIAEAIAYAEGFYVDGSRPQRNNNPGDLTKALGFASIGWDSIYVVFKTVEDGWAALRKQVQLMLTNQSSVYNSNMTILDVARRYTTTQQNEWAANVASHLGVPMTTKISEV